MKNHRIVSTVVLAASTFVFAAAANAAPVAVSPSLHAMFGKSKMVGFNLRNDSATALKLKAGDNVLMIDAGKTLAVKLPAGTSITTEEATTTHPAGTVIAQVSGDLSGATLSVK